MPPVTDQPSTKSIRDHTWSSCVAGPLKASLVDEEAGDVRTGATNTCIDTHWLPGRVELRVLGHQQSPGEVVAEVEEGVWMKCQSTSHHERYCDLNVLEYCTPFVVTLVPFRKPFMWSVEALWYLEKTTSESPAPVW